MALRGNQLVRTRQSRREAAPRRTLDAGASPAPGGRIYATPARPVVVVATSRGATRAPAALPPAPTAGLVLTSAMLDTPSAYAGSPGALPRTLVIHHRQDGCRDAALCWWSLLSSLAGGRARAVWLTGGWIGRIRARPLAITVSLAPRRMGRLLTVTFCEF